MKHTHFQYSIVGALAICAGLAFAGMPISAETFAGIGMLGGVGSIEVIIKTLENIERLTEKVDVEQRCLADRVLYIEQKSSELRNCGAGTGAGNSLGDLFLKQFQANDNRNLFEKTQSLRLKIETKAAGDAITTTSGRRIESGGVGVVGPMPYGMQHAIPNRSASGISALEYSRYTGKQGAAAVQAGEGAAKPAIRPDHSLIVQNAITIAGFANLSRQALNDSDELKRAIDTTISDSVSRALNEMLLNGSVTPAFGGFNTLGTSFTSLTYTLRADAIAEGISDMQGVGFVPDTLVMSPEGWLAITTQKGSDGHYMTGNYLGETSYIFQGLRVVLAPGIPAGKSMIVDSRHSDLLVVDGFSIELGYTGSQFTENMITILGECRVIPVFRSDGSIRLITPKA